jgi:hypothetical protein
MSCQDFTFGQAFLIVFFFSFVCFFLLALLSMANNLFIAFFRRSSRSSLVYLVFVDGSVSRVFDNIDAAGTFSQSLIADGSLVKVDIQTFFLASVFSGDDK